MQQRGDPLAGHLPPRLRHVYSQRPDLTVQVQLGLLVVSLSVALLGYIESFSRSVPAAIAAAARAARFRP
jgi:hypothetical protein